MKQGFRRGQHNRAQYSDSKQHIKGQQNRNSLVSRAMLQETAVFPLNDDNLGGVCSQVEALRAVSLV
jgi:hypothetical protein